MCVAPPDHCARGRDDDFRANGESHLPMARSLRPGWAEFPSSPPPIRTHRQRSDMGMNTWLGNEHLTGLTASWLLGPLGYVIFSPSRCFCSLFLGGPPNFPKTLVFRPALKTCRSVFFGGNGTAMASPLLVFKRIIWPTAQESFYATRLPMEIYPCCLRNEWHRRIRPPGTNIDFQPNT